MSTVTLAEALSALRWAGAIKSSVHSKGTEVLTWLYKTHDNYTTHVWGYDPNVKNTEHHSGYSLDFMTFTNKAMGDLIYAYLWANRDRLGVKHIIWQQSIISTQINPGVRRKMGDRGNPTNNHMDHVHVMFLSTAYRAPSGPASPIPSTGAKKIPAPLNIKTGRDEAFNKMLQRYLNYAVGAKLVVDGDFGPKTAGAMEKWLGDKVKDQSLSKAAVIKLQRVIGTKPDGAWGPNTTRAFKIWLNNHRTLLRY